MFAGIISIIAVYICRSDYFLKIDYQLYIFFSRFTLVICRSTLSMYSNVTGLSSLSTAATCWSGEPKT